LVAAAAKIQKQVPILVQLIPVAVVAVLDQAEL
jgi:hypothetical protein